MINVNSVQKSFGDLKAVDGLTFEIGSGEAFGLLGPNGAGKTTTISMLVGLLKPDSGEVLVGGESPLLPKCRARIGIAPQALSLYEELSGRENLEFFGSLYGLAGSALGSRVEWALEFSGLQDRAKDRVGQYSGGMKRRMNIAVAMIQDPDILLLDEPTVGVDPQSRNHIFDSIEQLKSKGLTIIYTTHYMEEAQRLCDRVAIVDHGKLMALDTVPNLLDQHGGTSVVQAEVLEFPDSIQVPGQRDGNSIRFESNQPLQEIATLTSKGLQFQTLNVARPDLESVFLNLTGRSLRD
jgi:ABC-2 type transport system ATP-binding protein